MVGRAEHRKERHTSRLCTLIFCRSFEQCQHKLELLQVTPEEIEAAVANAIDRDRARLLEDRYHASTNGLLGAVCSADPWSCSVMAG